MLLLEERSICVTTFYTFAKRLHKCKYKITLKYWLLREERFYNDKFENKHFFLGEDDMEETGGQISNVGQQVDGSSDAEESQRLVSYTFYIVNKFDNIIYSHERYLCCHHLFL